MPLHRGRLLVLGAGPVSACTWDRDHTFVQGIDAPDVTGYAPDVKWCGVCGMAQSARTGRAETLMVAERENDADYVADEVGALVVDTISQAARCGYPEWETLWIGRSVGPGSYVHFSVGMKYTERRP